MSGGLDISVTIDGLSDLERLWDRAPELTRRELSAAMREGLLLLGREVSERTPVGIGGGGGLKGSISAREPRVLANQVIGVVSTSLTHALPVELGTRPHFPPVQPLADWAQAKLGVPESEARSVGFLIARKISRVGTKGHHMFRDAFAANRSQVHRMFTDATRRIRDALSGRGA